MQKAKTTFGELGLETFASFWGRNPALLFGFSVLLGTGAAFQPHWLLFLLFFFLICTIGLSHKLIVCLICFAGAFFSTHYRCPKILLPQEKIPGTAIFHIDNVKVHSSPFHRSLLYQGTLRQFQADDGTIYTDLPCSLFLPLFGKRMPANIDYAITGSLTQKAEYTFVLKHEKKTTWTPIPTLFNLSEWRFKAKQSIAKSLKRQIKDPASCTFLTALTTGEVDERILSMEMGKIGLQHILAISGFHFALVALFVSFLLRLIFPYKISAALLIATLSLYYLFLGNAPSIQRAYIAISLVALGQLFSLRISGLNALGCGLLAELIVHPLIATQLSFQLSFLCTLAILLFTPAVHRALTLVLPKRSHSSVATMSLIDQHGYVLSALLRKTLAINLAVHLISLPVLLFLFHKFPLLSIAYNLFFPLCASLSMFLLFTAFLFSLWLPPLSHAIHALNNAWTSALLNISSNPPAFLNFSIHTNVISFSMVICFLGLAFFFGVLFYEKERAQNLP